MPRLESRTKAGVRGCGRSAIGRGGGEPFGGVPFGSRGAGREPGGFVRKARGGTRRGGGLRSIAAL